MISAGNTQGHRDSSPKCSTICVPVTGAMGDETGISLREWTDLPPGTYRWTLVVSDATSTVGEDG